MPCATRVAGELMTAAALPSAPCMLRLLRAAGDLVAEARDEAVDHRAGEDGEQDDREAGDDGGERVGAAAGAEGSGQAEHDHDDRFHQDHGDHDARPAAHVAPQVLVDEARVDDGAEQGADVQQGGPDDQLEPEHAGGEDRDQRDDDQHDRAAADVAVPLFEGAGERPEEGVRLVAGRVGEDLGHAVGRRHDGVEDQRGERGGEHGQPEEADRPRRSPCDGGTPRTARLATARSHRTRVRKVDGGEDDGVLLEEAGVGEVDVGGVVHGVGELVDDPGGGVGAALRQGGERVQGGARTGVGAESRFAGSLGRRSCSTAWPGRSGGCTGSLGGARASVPRRHGWRSSTAVVCTAVTTAGECEGAACGLPGIREPSVLLDGLADLVGGGGLVVAGDRGRPVLLGVRRRSSSRRCPTGARRSRSSTSN